MILWSDPIAVSAPKSTWSVLVKIKGDGNLAKTQKKKWWEFEHIMTSRTKGKVTLKTFNGYFRYKLLVELGESAPVYSLINNK